MSNTPPHTKDLFSSSSLSLSLVSNNQLLICMNILYIHVCVHKIWYMNKLNLVCFCCDWILCCCFCLNWILKAGIFRYAGEAAETSGMEMASDEVRQEDTADISSDNSGPVRSRSEEDFDCDDVHDGDDKDNDDKNRKKKRKYHRHTTEQIREMEAYVNSLTLRISIRIN